LVCDPIDPIGTEKLKNAGFTIEFLECKETLKEKIKDCDAIIVRSRKLKSHVRSLITERILS